MNKSWQDFFLVPDFTIQRILTDNPTNADRVSVLDLPPAACTQKGIRHWLRVSINASFLLRKEFIDDPPLDAISIGNLFGLFHDCRYACQPKTAKNHGHLAYEYYQANFLHSFKLDRAAEEILCCAIDVHMDLGPKDMKPSTKRERILGCLLDADRLDIRRIGVMPKASRLFTKAAMEMADRRDFRELDANCRSLLTYL